MASPSVMIAACFIYVAFILAVALWTERKAAAGREIANNPFIYALSLTIYHTAWTFYGNVGRAASTGMLFLPIYLGPTLAIMLWWVLLRKMVRIKNAFRITSIADFISLRYNKSNSVAALVTVICLFGLVPYFALQLKGITAALAAVTHFNGSASPRVDTGLIFAALIIVATVVLGVRRLAPTARHQGMVVAMTAAGLVKLAAFLALGLYVTYGFFGGFGDLFQRFAANPVSLPIDRLQTTPSFYLMWFSYLILSMSAIMFLPSQFHLEVIENFQPRHIRTAMWLLPLYMLLINIFVVPITIAGLLTGIPSSLADSYAIILPLAFGETLLALVVFVGGFAAATGMVMVTSMTVSIMVTNHLLLPVIDSVPFLAFMKRYLLQCRWGTVTLLVLAGYWFQREVGSYFFLLNIGLIAFAAVLQVAPSLIGGLFWKRGNAAGALMGMGSGFLLWGYTLIVPSFVRSGLLSADLLEHGPWGLTMLRPEHLLGVSGLDTISHAVFFTLLFNVGLYVIGSLYFVQRQRERELAQDFVEAFAGGSIAPPLVGEATVPLAEKKAGLQELFSQYFPEEKSAAIIGGVLARSGAGASAKMTLPELAQLAHEAEVRLASSIGAAAAHKALGKSGIITAGEEKALRALYADIIAELKLTPAELKAKIDYHQEREKLLTTQARELEEKVRERDREIEERRKAEEALKDSERRFADIIEFLPDATFVVDADGRIIIWNRAAEEVTGVDAEDMLGKGDQEYSIPFFGYRRPLLVDLVLNPTEEVQRLYPNVTRDGRVLIDESPTRSVKRGSGYVVIMAAPLYDAEGRLTAVIESVRDITERREAEEEVKKHRDRLEELVRERTAELTVAKERAEVASQAKSAFLSSMSHELRTPLNAILGYAQILKRQENLTDIQRQQLETMRASGEHLLLLINDILDMSKIEAQRMELEESSFDLCVMLRQVFEIARIKAEEKSLAFQYEEKGALPKYVRGDARKFKQVLLNILSNAVKYTRHGQVVMRVAHAGDSGLFDAEVADTGIGIAADKLEAIFEPFTQLAGAGQVREGTGLGLSITKRLVELMQGKLTVVSEPGKGTTFRVELPLPVVSGSVACGEALPRTITGYQGPRKRILVADDNVTNTSMLVSLLEPLGFELFTAGDGREAVSQALARRPDLVVLDLVMPELDGLDAVQEIRRHPELQGTCIIGTSAMVSGTPRKEAFAAACDAFLVKPISHDLLLDKMRERLGIVWEYSAGVGPGTGSAEPPEPDEPVEAPPPEELAELHELAVMGNMQKIQAWAAGLEEREPRYAPFAGKLRDLAARYKARALVELVEQHMREPR